MLVKPIPQRVFEYPTFVQTAKWTASPTEGITANEEISFNTVEGLDVLCQIQVLNNKIVQYKTLLVQKTASKKIPPKHSNRNRKFCLLFGAYTTYDDEAVSPPRPVQFVWKNSPRGLSTRSY
jgi:hypothetical protein